MVFVHGISGSPAIFFKAVGGGLSLVAQVQALGGVSAWTFDYRRESLDWVDNPDIGPALAAGIDCLAHQSGTSVILVDHSMGGLASQFAAAVPDPFGGSTGAHISEVITMGTPFQGSKLLTVAQDLIAGSEAAAVADGGAGLAAAMEAILSYCAGRSMQDLANGGGNLCRIASVPRSPVGSALEEHSSAINALSPWPANLPVYDIAGDIRLRVGYGFISHTFDIGDGLVELASATAHDTVGSAGVVVCHETLLHPLGSGLPCYHGDLPSNPAIVTDVLDAIRKGMVAKLADASLPPGICDPSMPAVTLVNGSGTTGTNPQLPGYFDVSILAGPFVADLAGNGAPDVAVVFNCDGGGSLNWTFMFLLRVTAAGVSIVAGPLGPRSTGNGEGARIAGLAVRGSELVVSEAYSEPGDPLCCFSGRTTTTWAWSGGHLVIVSPAPVRAVMVVATAPSDSLQPTPGGHTLRVGSTVEVVCSGLSSSDHSAWMELDTGQWVPIADVRPDGGVPSCNT